MCNWILAVFVPEAETFVSTFVFFRLIRRRHVRFLRLLWTRMWINARWWLFADSAEPTGPFSPSSSSSLVYSCSPAPVLISHMDVSPKVCFCQSALDTTRTWVDHGLMEDGRSAVLTLCWRNPPTFICARPPTAPKADTERLRHPWLHLLGSNHQPFNLRPITSGISSDCFCKRK